MFDTMTMVKVMGSLCGALLIFLLGGWAAESIYHRGGGHGEETQAYVIEVPDAEGGEGQEVVDLGPPFEEVFANADAAAGEGEFRPCSACHKLEDGANGVGPHLYGVVGRTVDAVAGYEYSGALEQVADVWSPENLNAFLTNPSEYAPGTKMNFRGIADVQDRANLIAYLQTIGG